MPIIKPQTQFSVATQRKILSVQSQFGKLFHDAFTFISSKPKLNPPLSVQPNQLNVAILMLNSVSRAQFLRHMFFTLKVMRQNDFQNFNGYTKVENCDLLMALILELQLADDTDTNLLAILSGKVYDSEKHGNPSVVENKKHSPDDVSAYSNSLIRQFKGFNK
ncbi:hypothetical protein M3Y98_00017700 [Aphelenchoides besseyi]|nr:hypothetical protein M3Y98_00017700 [Aphelenchoides besseyi]KAI6199222.1 hypothetical protein M3Y96_00603500 [Aphelenchoides besseyi]